MDRLPAPREIQPIAAQGRLRRSRRAWGARASVCWSTAPAVVLALTLVGCGSGSEDAAKKSADAAEQPSATATVSGGEVKLVSAVRPKIDALVDALQDGDVSRARAAYADYDAAWNGVEVYVNVRDLSLYEKLEDDLQSPIGDALEAAKPDLAAQVATAKELGTTLDQAIDNSTAGPKLSPLFDDVTALRIVRSDLRRATDLLDAGGVPGARKRFTTFRGNYDLVQERVRARSDTADAPLAAAIAAATAAFEQPKPAAASLSPLVAAVTDRYGFALGL